jgi:hypothetical protein
MSEGEAGGNFENCGIRAGWRADHKRALPTQLVVPDCARICGDSDGGRRHAKQYSGVGNAPLFTSRTKLCTASCTEVAPFM